MDESLFRYFFCSILQVLFGGPTILLVLYTFWNTSMTDPLGEYHPIFYMVIAYLPQLVIFFIIRMLCFGGSLSEGNEEFAGHNTTNNPLFMFQGGIIGILTTIVILIGRAVTRNPKWRDGDYILLPEAIHEKLTEYLGG